MFAICFVLRSGSPRRSLPTTLRTLALERHRPERSVVHDGRLRLPPLALRRHPHQSLVRNQRAATLPSRGPCRLRIPLTQGAACWPPGRLAAWPPVGLWDPGGSGAQATLRLWAVLGGCALCGAVPQGKTWAGRRAGRAGRAGGEAGRAGREAGRASWQAVRQAGP